MLVIDRDRWRDHWYNSTHFLSNVRTCCGVSLVKRWYMMEELASDITPSALGGDKFRLPGCKFKHDIKLLLKPMYSYSIILHNKCLQLVTSCMLMCLMCKCASALVLLCIL